MPIDLSGFETSGYDSTFENSELGSFVVSTTPVLNSNPPIHHWRASALYKINEETRSTVLDACTGPGTEFPDNMIIKVTNKDFDMVPEATIQWVYDSFSDREPRVTLKQILELMVSYKMHAFRSDKNGHGCLTWVSGLLIVLERRGILPAGSYEEVKKVAEKAGLRGRVPGDCDDTRNADFIYPGIF
ncbi:hypothetical protein AGABI1DRAFT_129528 [Agaricus bisporus var. burnettii JB137-S8]|uniref:DUF7770 domain-containing protein n=1 Tax=Agaricus bisporus var. burnettii (strain JB137-S8 / ATCC MYA-4627 / FGSC 10392) TaxID=597362 RepID=K5VVB1_AGABU|nr:uncharacterized protein AGABI1DRAFT_129528 [Agaricus bisporus var. burnettii JB137-S8]EKM78414.1 hypothetical protein AGABI1DRAFT_129528 [Agaricus bisporus var. burnettii JB137-S8]